MSTTMPAPAAATQTARRSDAGMLRLSQRDIDGLLLVAEHTAAPYDLLAAALRVEPPRLRAIVGRWRRIGYAATGRIGPGPAWCWLTRDGMDATGLSYPPGRPPLPRLDHLRAVLAARLWLQATPDYLLGTPWWQSERRIHRKGPWAGTHRPDAEIHWPSTEHCPHPGQIWAIEVELTAKHSDRAAQIMDELTAPGGYDRAVYLTAPRARGVLTRCAAGIQPPSSPVDI